MTGMLCAFILTKSSNLSLYYFPSFFFSFFFSYAYNYVVIDSLAENEYSEISSYCGGFDSGDA